MKLVTPRLARLGPVTHVGLEFLVGRKDENWVGGLVV